MSVLSAVDRSSITKVTYEGKVFIVHVTASEVCELVLHTTVVQTVCRLIQMVIMNFTDTVSLVRTNSH